MKAAYVSSGNLPSRFAHSIQIVKNAQSWSRFADDFCFYINLDSSHYRNFDHDGFNSFYGVKTPFHIHKYPFFYTAPHWRIERFTKWFGTFLSNIYFSKVAKQLHNAQCELVYTRTMGLPAHTLPLKIPTIVETHGPPDGAKDKDAMYKLLGDENFLGLITITDELKKRMVDYGLPEEKVIVAPDGVDLDMYESALNKQQARKKLGYPVDGKYALYVGHLYKDRGIKEILYSAEKMPDVTFVIVGGHQEDINYWQQVIQTKSLKNVDLVGFVENRHVPMYQWMADVLLMPYSHTCSTSEWMSPLKLFEYMASGRAVIASRMKVFEGILEHKKNGYLVDADNGSALLKGLTTVFGNHQLMEKMGQQAQQDIKQYSWDARVKFILDFAKNTGRLKATK